MPLRTKRVHEGAAPSDGTRILIDRLWPRGISKEVAQIDFWARSVVPSSELRQWYRHEIPKWEEFRRRYFAELDSNPTGVDELRLQLGAGTTTLVFGSREERFNNATALCEYLGQRETTRV